MPSDCELAKNDFIEKKDILKIPLIFHRRAGLQQLISHWADTDIKNFNIAAGIKAITYLKLEWKSTHFFIQIHENIYKIMNAFSVVCFVSTKDAGKVFFTY